MKQLINIYVKKVLKEYKMTDILKKMKKYLNEKKAINTEEGNPLRFVFKLPKSGNFTADFEDGTSVEVNIDPDDKCAGKYAMIAKGSGRPMECWDEKPSRSEVAQRLKELKFFGGNK